MWNFTDLNADGLHNGIIAIFVAPHNIVPWWVEDDSVQQFLALRLKTATLVQTIAEIKEFSEEPLPDDSQLAAEHKQAQKRAERLQSTLKASCNDLYTSLKTSAKIKTIRKRQGTQKTSKN